MSEWFVVCLCAGWCGVCKEYSAGFRALASRHPEAAFHWVDIEDEADVIGDVDVETFPTLLIARDTEVHHFGALPPQPEILARLLNGFHAEPGRVSKADAETRALWLRVRGVLGADTACADPG
jgi:thioredoxin 1